MFEGILTSLCYLAAMKGFLICYQLGFDDHEDVTKFTTGKLLEGKIFFAGREDVLCRMLISLLGRVVIWT